MFMISGSSIVIAVLLIIRLATSAGASMIASVRSVHTRINMIPNISCIIPIVMLLRIITVLITNMVLIAIVLFRIVIRPVKIHPLKCIVHLIHPFKTKSLVRQMLIAVVCVAMQKDFNVLLERNV